MTVNVCHAVGHIELKRQVIVVKLFEPFKLVVKFPEIHNKSLQNFQVPE